MNNQKPRATTRGLLKKCLGASGYNVLGWAWNGDGGSMNMVTPSWASNATATSFSTSSYFSVVYNKL